jgi:hypothetical protein
LPFCPSLEPGVLPFPPTTEAAAAAAGMPPGACGS